MYWCLSQIIMCLGLDKADYREYTFTADQLPSFRTYRIKINLTSTNQSFVPRVKDLRVIALADMDFYGLEGHKDLARDPETNAVVNVNGLDYQQYLSRRKIKNETNQKAHDIEQEVAKMKGDIDEIKSLLKELLNGPRNN